MFKLASRSTFMTLALVAPVVFVGCKDTPSPKSLPMTIEIAEVDPAASIRHLFDKEGNSIDLGIVSSLKLKAEANNPYRETGEQRNDAIPMSPTTGVYMNVRFVGDDDAVFRKWTGARQKKVMAMIVDDQAYVVATIQSPLSGWTQLYVPTVIRSEPVKAFVEQSLR